MSSNLNEEQLRVRGLWNLQVGAIYKLKSRNLEVGVYDGNGFIGIREKFGSRFLFTEYPRTIDGKNMPFETVDRAEKISILESGIPINEGCGSLCSTCSQAAYWTGPPAPAPWVCDGGCEDTRPYFNSNRALFKALDKISP